MIAKTFERLKQTGDKALICFVMAGDPSLEQLPDLLSCLAESGADIIEVGIPFSDPIADGPAIQAAGQRALDRGVTPSAVLAKLKECVVDVPIVLMGYVNPALRTGLEAFAKAAVAAGVSGVILSDMIPDESEEWIRVARAHGLDTIFLAAPTSTDDRIEAACNASRGFIYAVSRTGVTGATSSLSEDALGLVSRIRPLTNLPICVGFGISDASHVRAICKTSDGAVIGSKLVTEIHENWNDGTGRDRIAALVRSWKEAARYSA